MILAVILSVITHVCNDFYASYPTGFVSQGQVLDSQHIPGGCSNEIRRVTTNTLASFVGLADARVRRAMASSLFGTGGEKYLIRSNSRKLYPNNNDNLRTNGPSFLLDDADGLSTEELNYSNATLRITSRYLNALKDSIGPGAYSILSENMYGEPAVGSWDSIWSYSTDGGTYFGSYALVGSSSSFIRPLSTAVSCPWNEDPSEFTVNWECFYRDYGRHFAEDGIDDRSALAQSLAMASESPIVQLYYDYFHGFETMEFMYRIQSLDYETNVVENGWTMLSAISQNTITNVPTITRRIDIRDWAFADSAYAAMDIFFGGTDVTPLIRYATRSDYATIQWAFDAVPTQVNLTYDSQSNSYVSVSSISMGNETNVISHYIGSTNITLKYLNVVNVGGVQSKIDLTASTDYVVPVEELTALAAEAKRKAFPTELWVRPNFIIEGRTVTIHIIGEDKVVSATYQAPEQIACYVDGSAVLQTGASVGRSFRQAYDYTLSSNNLSRPCCFPHPVSVSLEGLDAINTTTLQGYAHGSNITEHVIAGVDESPFFEPTEWRFRFNGNECVSVSEVNETAAADANELEGITDSIVQRVARASATDGAVNIARNARRITNRQIVCEERARELLASGLTLRGISSWCEIKFDNDYNYELRFVESHEPSLVMYATISLFGSRTKDETYRYPSTIYNYGAYSSQASIEAVDFRFSSMKAE